MESIDDVAFFLGAKTVPSTMAVETDLPPKEWVVVQGAGEKGDAEERGTWVQRARFQTSVRLSVPPTFATWAIECLVRVEVLLYACLSADLSAVHARPQGALPWDRQRRPDQYPCDDCLGNRFAALSSRITTGVAGFCTATCARARPPAVSHVIRVLLLADNPCCRAYWDVNGHDWGDLDVKD